MIKMLRYLRRREWLFILISLIGVVIQVWLSLKLPDYMALITRLVQTDGHTMAQILDAGIMMLLCTLGIFAITFVTGYFVSKTSSALAMRLRERVFEKTISFSMSGINRFSTSSLITRSTNDITQVMMFVMIGLKVGVRAPIMAVWAIIKMSVKNWQWTAATGVLVCILLAMIGTIFILAIPKFRIIQRLTDNLNRVTREHLSGIRVVHAYNAEKYQENKFAHANTELSQNSLYTSRLMALFEPGVQFLMTILILVIYWIGAYLINGATMGARMTLFSDMIVFSSYATQVLASFMILTMILMFFSRATVSARRINEVLDTPSEIVDGAIDHSAHHTGGSIEFKNVCFRYTGMVSDVLHTISFSVSPGQTVAIIGATASGKSTLIDLIPRFYDATSGEVLVDGINVKEYKQTTLRDKLGYVSQRAVLFRGTVASNVAFGSNGRRRPSVAQIKKAISVAQAAGFVDRMRGRIQGIIAQAGTNLSGGQRQRLSIARAVCRAPEIYIFDDSFSALDYKTDSAVRRALKEHTNGATTVIVAQRVGTIIDADQILVLDNGRIVGRGTHKELMAKCKIYREIAESQLGTGAKNVKK